jgi:hypothetical protein
MWCCGGQNSSEVATRISTLADNFGLVRNSPARPITLITYLRRNLIPEALGIKASSGWRHFGASHTPGGGRYIQLSNDFKAW